MDTIRKWIFANPIDGIDEVNWGTTTCVRFIVNGVFTHYYLIKGIEAMIKSGTLSVENFWNQIQPFIDN